MSPRARVGGLWGGGDLLPYMNQHRGRGGVGAHVPEPSAGPSSLPSPAPLSPLPTEAKPGSGQPCAWSTRPSRIAGSVGGRIASHADHPPPRSIRGPILHGLDVPHSRDPGQGAQARANTVSYVRRQPERLSRDRGPERPNRGGSGDRAPWLLPHASLWPGSRPHPLVLSDP